jgi:hypothetical protein
MPAALSVRIHWSVSTAVGSNRDSGSAPDPHSRLVNVSMLKCVNAVTGRCCQASWPARGTVFAALAMIRSIPLHGSTGMIDAGAMCPWQALSPCVDGD